MLKVILAIYSAVVVLIAAILSVLWFFIFWSILLLGLKNSALQHFFIRSWNRIMFHLFLARLEVEGLENYDPKRPCIVISNHQSLLDIPTVYETFSGPIKMVGKAGLFKIPFFGWALTAAGLVPIERGNKDSAKRSIEAMRGRIKEGIQLWLAPEGTRSKDGNILPFKSGAFRLSVDLDLPIVALVISGTRDSLPKGSFIIKPFKTVKVKVLPPKRMADVGATNYKQLSDYYENEFKKHLKEL